MSNLWTNQFVKGRKSTSRGLRIGRGVVSLCVTLGLFVSAGTAWAAEVMEVRVGRHPEFTRLVFELDRAVGYRIQRTDAGADSELVISLEASSSPRNLRSSRTLIETVDITPNGSRSVARIRLTEDGFRLKEMILSNPPRIVLDLVSEKAVAKAAASRPSASSMASRAAEDAKAAADAKAKAAATAAANAKAKAMEMAAAKTEAAASAAAKAKAEAAEKLAAESKRLEDAAKSAAAAASATADRAMASAKTTAQATSDTVSNAAEKSKEMASNATAAASDKVADMKGKAEELSFDGLANRNSDAGDASAPHAANTVENTDAKPKVPRPMVAKKTAEGDGGWMTWALVAAGALVVGGAGLLFARRRGDSDEVDFSDDEDEVDFEGETATVLTSEEDENPFQNLAGSTESNASVASAAVAPFADDDGMYGESTTTAPLSDEEKEPEAPVFERIQENNMDDMEVISRDQVNESLGGAIPPVGGIPEEFQQMMREMKSRVDSLEGRVEELVDARDRLERQVAAQTEELRVQRAAIARTQRAVRNLARPEDAGEEEATEPALRDPNQ